jgi:hypothetical protein
MLGRRDLRRALLVLGFLLLLLASEGALTLPDETDSAGTVATLRRPSQHDHRPPSHRLRRSSPAGRVRHPTAVDPPGRGLVGCGHRRAVLRTGCRHHRGGGARRSVLAGGRWKVARAPTAGRRPALHRRAGVRGCDRCPPRLAPAGARAGRGHGHPVCGAPRPGSDRASAGCLRQHRTHRLPGAGRRARHPERARSTGRRSLLILRRGLWRRASATRAGRPPTLGAPVRSGGRSTPCDERRCPRTA